MRAAPLRRCIARESHAVRQSRRHPRLLSRLARRRCSDSLTCRRAPAAESDKAAGQPRPPRRTRDLAGAMAGPRAAAARSRHHRRVRRQSWRRRARRLGLSASGHRADGGEFRRRRRGHQPDRQSLPAPNCAWCRSNSSGRRAISPKPPRWMRDEFLDAVDAGYRTVPEDCDLLAVGEMGIANTTAAAMLCAALLGGGAARWAGRGTGVDDGGLARKRAAIEAGAEFPSRHSRRSAGGGGSAGRPRTRGDRGRRARRAAAHRIPVLLDGFVATSAVLPLARLDAGALDHCRAGHVSAESGHRDLLRELGLRAAARPRHAARRSVRRGRRDPAGRAPRWPAMPEWRHSRRPASPARRIDETLPHMLSVTSSRAVRTDEGAAHANGGHQGHLLPRPRYSRQSRRAGRDSHPREPRRSRSDRFSTCSIACAQSGERVVIDGPCLSACTLVLMTIPEERICVTRRAVLGFHAARSIDRRGRMYAEPEASRAVQEAYPAPVRGLDQPPRRIDVADVAVARARTRGDLSAVQVSAFVGWAKAQLRRAHHF